MQKLTKTDKLTVNLRYLLWRSNPDTAYIKWSDRLQKWSNCLSGWLQCPSTRAKQLLCGTESLAQADLLALQNNAGMDNDRFMAFQNSYLCETEQCDIWHENIIFLLENLQHGQYQELAKYLKVSQANFSKWKRKTSRPTIKKKSQLLSFFSLPSHIDLEQDPIFLSIEPLSVMEQKEYLKYKIDILEESTLTELFPALDKLLR